MPERPIFSRSPGYREIPDCPTCWNFENAKTVASCLVEEIVDFANNVEFADIVKIAEIVKIGQNATYDNNADSGEKFEIYDSADNTEIARTADIAKIH